MNRTRIKRYIMISILFSLVPLHGLAQGQIGEAKAIEIVRNFYNALNSYAHYAYEFQGEEHRYQLTREQIISYFDSRKIVVIDINHLRNGRDLEDGTIEQYLRILNEIAKDREVKFELINMPHMSNRETGGVQVTINVLSTENSYQNTFGFTFKGDKIVNICVMDKFKKIKNINSRKPIEKEKSDKEKRKKQKEKKPCYPLEPNLSYGAGIKLGTSIDGFGESVSLGIRGLTKNWFVSRMNFGIESMFLFVEKSEYPSHYPSSSNGQPSTLTYAVKKNGDFPLGINLGYTFLPGKHNQGEHHLTASMGVGGMFYDFWYEKTGPSKKDYVSHHSSALYLKPSLRWDYDIIGIELGYYICPQYSPIQGMNIHVIVNL